VVIESPSPLLREQLTAIAELLQMKPLALPPRARVLYHIAANFSASFLLTTLGEALELWKLAGLDPEQALAALLPLARGSLQNAEALGLTGALSGPVARGDLEVVRAHLSALANLQAHHKDDSTLSIDSRSQDIDGTNDSTLSTESLSLYRALAMRQLRWLSKSGRLTREQCLSMSRMLSDPERGISSMK
jgi:hypothetical protein